MQDQPLVSGMHRGTDEAEQREPLCDVEAERVALGVDGFAR